MVLGNICARVDIPIMSYGKLSMMVLVSCSGTLALCAKAKNPINGSIQSNL